MGLFDMLFGGANNASSCNSKKAVMTDHGTLDQFKEWAKTATKEELSEELEKNRQRYLRTGDRGPTESTLQKEMYKRLEEEAKNDPYRNTDPNYRWTDKNRWE